MPLSVEELLLPRYKVIAPYPFNEHFKVGEILTLFKAHNIADNKDEYFYHYKKGSVRSPYETNFQDVWFDFFPHIFKRLEWYEERKAEDMPEYVKTKDSWEVYKIDVACEKPFINNTIPLDFIWPMNYHYEPATVEQFNEWLEMKKK